MKEKRKKDPYCNGLRVRSANWGFPCSLNGGDHFYENASLLPKKRNTLDVHQTRSVGSIQLLVFWTKLKSTQLL